MKKLLLSLAFLMIGLTAAQSQTIKQDSAGNYYAVRKQRAAAAPAVNTGKVFTDSKGIQYPVMKAANGRLFVMRVSKTSGKEWKQYLTPATTKED